MKNRLKEVVLVLGLAVLLTACGQKVEEKVDQVEDQVDQVEEKIENAVEGTEDQVDDFTTMEGVVGEYLSHFSIDMREQTTNQESRFFVADAGERLDVDLDPRMGQAQVKVLDLSGQVLLELEGDREVEKKITLENAGQYEVQIETQDFAGSIDIDLDGVNSSKKVALTEAQDRLKGNLSEALEDLNIEYRMPSEIEESRTFSIKAGETFKVDLEAKTGTIEFTIKDQAGAEILKGQTEGRLEDQVTISEAGLYTVEILGQRFVGDLDLEIDD